MPRGKRAANPVTEATDALVEAVSAIVDQGLAADAEQPKRKGRPRKPKVKDTIRSYSQAEQDQARQNLCDSHDEYLSTHGLLRNRAKEVTKAIKEVATMTGASKKSVRWGVENRKRDPKDIDAETRERTRIAKFFGMPIGSQLGLALDGQSVAEKLETGDDPEDGMSSTERARHQGYAAGKAGGDQQHDYEEGSPEELAYSAAWREAQDEIAGRFKKPTHEAAHA